MKLSEIKSTMKKMSEGYRFEVIEGSGIFATVSRRSTKENKAKIGLVFIEYMKENGIERFEDLTQEQNIEASKIHIVRNLIKKIEGLQDEDGNEIEWSEEVGMKLFNDSDFSELINRIMEKSEKDEYFFSQELKKKSGI